MSSSYAKIIKLLNDSGLPFCEYEHEPVVTSEQAANIRQIDPKHGAKSLLLKLKTEYILVVLPGDRKINFKKLKARLKVDNVQLATPEEVIQVMGCPIGACYPFGNVAGIKAYVDQSLSQAGFIACNIGLHTRSVEMKWDDYLRVAEPIIIDISKEK